VRKGNEADKIKRSDMTARVKRGKVLMLIEDISVPADTRVWAEAQTLHEHGFAVSVISPKGVDHDRESHACIKGIHIYRYHAPVGADNTLAYLWEYGLSMLSTTGLSIKVLYKHNFDVIHAANPPDMFFVLAWFYRLFGKRFVFDQHDLSPEMFQIKFKGRKRFLYNLLVWLEKRSYQASSVVITTNLSQKRIALTRGKCNPQKVFVVRNGPKLQRLYRVTPEPELKEGHAHLLAYVGSMEQQDGIDYALHMLHELVNIRGHQDILLVLMGDGGHLPKLKTLAQELDIVEHIHFTGWVDSQQIVRYLSTAEIGICPDPMNGLNEYCTMVKTMEYMAMSLPIVAFDLAETRYSAQEAALYAQPNDVADFATQVETLLADQELRRTMGESGRERVINRLNWDHDKRNLLRAYSVLFPDAIEDLDPELQDKQRDPTQVS
jgi:glycosyltransferase involved in cell wall biosynthesis